MSAVSSAGRVDLAPPQPRRARTGPRPDADRRRDPGQRVRGGGRAGPPGVGRQQAAEGGVLGPGQSGDRRVDVSDSGCGQGGGDGYRQPAVALDEYPGGGAPADGARRVRVTAQGQRRDLGGQPPPGRFGHPGRYQAGGVDRQPALAQRAEQRLRGRLGHPQRGGLAEHRLVCPRPVEQVEYPCQRRIGELQHDRAPRIGTELDGMAVPPQPAQPGKQRRTSHGDSVSPEDFAGFRCPQVNSASTALSTATRRAVHSRRGQQSGRRQPPVTGIRPCRGSG